MTETESDKPETVRVNFVIPEPKREKWDKYVENESDLKSRTDLIVRAVEHEIAGQNGTNGPQSDEVALQVADVSDKMETLINRFDSVESRLQSLEAESRTDEDLGRLTSEIFEILPDVRPGTPEYAEIRSNPGGRVDMDNPSRFFQAWSGTVSGLAKALDEPEYRVREAVEKLMDDTHIVRAVEFKDETRYYKDQ